MSDRNPVILVLGAGAGAGIGGHVAKRFAAGGYHAVLARRSDEDALLKLVAEIKANGGDATGRLLNATEDGAIEDLVFTVERDIGPIEVALFNLGAQIGNRSLADTAQNLRTWAAVGDVRIVPVGESPTAPDGRQGAWNAPRHLNDRRHARKRRPAFACCGDGRQADAMPNARCGFRAERRSRRAWPSESGRANTAISPRSSAIRAKMR